MYYNSSTNGEVFIEIIDNTFYTVYPGCDLIRIDLIIKLDGADD